MTHLSGRFGVALILIFLIALTPMIYARWTGERNECENDAVLLDPEALYPDIRVITEGPLSTNPETRRLTGLLEPANERKGPMVFSIVRSFGLPSGLLQPADSLPGKREPDVVDLNVLEADGVEIPIRYASEELVGAVRTTTYFMAHRGKPVSNPLWTRLSSAPAAFFTGRWPITLFVISTRSHPAEVENVRGAMNDWVRAVWRHYQAVCPV